MDPTLLLGVDLGGTKVEAVVVRHVPGAANADVVARARVPTDRDRGYEHVLDVVAGIVTEVARRAQLPVLPPIGIGMPGSVTSSGLVKNSNTTCLNGRPFRQQLAERIGVPIVYANDANCFAVAEATWGAARGARVAFGVILGTGCGGGVVFDGVGWEGTQGVAGEWGHVSLEPESGPPCYCGRRGCVEQFLSGPAIERAYAEAAAAMGLDAQQASTRRLPEIAERAASGEDDAARATLATTMRRFGRAMATVINILDPDVVVLGGGASNLPLWYTDGAREVGRWIFNDEVRTRIVQHAIGDSAGVLGAALLPWHSRAR